MINRNSIFRLSCCSLLLASLVIVGCERMDGTANSTGAATQPSVAIATTQPANDALAQNAAATQPASSSMIVGRMQEWFPRAMLRVTKEDGQVVARLYSDDPSGMLSGKETVNSYDLQMALPDIDDPANIAKAVWTSKSSTSDREDTPYGIFLNDEKQILQPMDVTIHFDGQAPHVAVMIEGTFREYSTNTEAMHVPANIVQVMAALHAVVPEK